MNEEWIKHAHPLQQIVIQLQGTRHSDRNDIIDLLETVIARLRSGDASGFEHDDDFGYSFWINEASSESSFFDEPAGQR